MTAKGIIQIICLIFWLVAFVYHAYCLINHEPQNRDDMIAHGAFAALSLIFIALLS